MKSNRKLLFFIYIALFSLNFLKSQVSFYVEASQTEISINQKIQVDFILNIKENSLDDFEQAINLPDFKDFEVLYRSMSQNTSIINGKFSKEITYQVLLKPLKNGTLIINTATIKIDNKVLKTKPLKINVSGNIPKNNQNQKKSNIQQQNQQGTFILCEPSNINPFINQAVGLTVALYTQNYSILDNISKIQPLQSFPGGMIIPIETNQRVEKVHKNGEIYLKAILQEYILYPNKSGNIQIPSLEVSILESDGFFSSREVPLNSEQINLNIKNLPQSGKPKNFSGAVGNFILNFNLDNKNIKENKKIEAEIELIGTGNFKLISIPELIIPEEIESFSKNKRDAFLATLQGLKGKITSNITLVPNYGGKFQIKTKEFSYFNPESQKYETIASKNIELNVSGKPKPKNQNFSLNDNKEEGKDDFLTKNIFENKIANKENTSNITFILIFLGLISSSIVGYIIFRKQKNKLINPEKNELITEDLVLIKDNNIININTENESEEIKPEKIDISDLQNSAILEDKKLYFSNLEQILKQININDFNNPEDKLKYNELLNICQKEKYSPFSEIENLLDFHVEVLNFINKL